MSISSDIMTKAFGMPSTDSTHQYLFKSGEYGSMYQYWYRDKAGNYYRYTNAPVDHEDYDPLLGLPLLDPDQPLPEKNPEFFTPEGLKRSMAVPQGVEPTRNPAYSQNDAANIWFEVVQKGKSPTYIYLDADVKENVDLYIQHQIRLVDATLARTRMYATQLFAGKHPKDRLTGAMIMLVDQGFYEVEELVNASVGDIQFIDQTVILLGRKFVCDLMFFDFLTSIVAQRSPQEPLFQLDTLHGSTPVGPNYLYSVFAAVRTSPKFLLSWNASHIFSRIMSRMSFQKIPPEVVEEQAFDELAHCLTTRDDVKYLVDFKLRVTLLRNYEEGIAKGVPHLTTDDFGIVVIRSDLTSLREDEKEFSDWLQAEPMHDTSPVEEQQIQSALEQANQPEAAQPAPGDEEMPSAGEQKAPEGGGSPEDQKEPAPTPPGEVPA